MLKKFINNFSYLAIIQISNTLLPLLIMPYLARIISPKNYGEIEFSRIFCYYFSIIILFGFDFTATRDISLHRNDKDKINEIISQTTYAKIILFIISTFFFLIITFSTSSFSEISWLLITTYVINIGYTFYPIWFFQGIENLKLISTLSFFIRLLIIILTILLLKTSKNFWLFNFFQGISFILISLVCYLLLRYRYDFRFKKIQFSKIKKIFTEGSPVFLSIILVTIMTSLFFLFLKINSDDMEMAKFSTSNKIIATIQGLVLMPFTQAFFPIITKQASENLMLFKKNIQIAGLSLFLLTFLLGILLFFFGDLFIIFLFGKKYLLSYSSLQVLAFLPMFASLTNVFAYQGLLSLKKDKLFLIIHLIFATLSIILSFFYINDYSAMIVSYIRLTIEILLFFTSFIFFIKTIKNKN